MKYFFANLLILILWSAVMPVYGSATVDESTISELAKATGLKESRISKIAQLSYSLEEAVHLALSGQTDRALVKVSEINLNSGFKVDDVKQAKSTKYNILKRAGRYEEALIVGRWLSDYHPNFKVREEEASALLTYQKSGDSKVIHIFLEGYFKNNKKILPPKGHDLTMLAIIVRMYETVGDIDQALVWVEKYIKVYFPKKGFDKEPSGIVKKHQQGLRLLKQALLRDKAESKNIYAQGLINTTEYFGFV